MIEKGHYTSDFYSGQESGSYRSAKTLLPLVNDIFHPASVADIGCGTGSWLKVWNEDLGVKDFFGVEGPYVTADMLHVPPANVSFQDLKLPLELNRRFDLVMTLEVAEHLPESSARQFVKSLTELSDVVLFSAALVGQEGEYHINEQMPEYWAEKFAEFGYVPVDYLRSKVWNNEAIEWWYRQNVLFFIKKDKLANYPELQDAYKNTDTKYLTRIHVGQYRVKLDQLKQLGSFSGFLGSKLHAFRRQMGAVPALKKVYTGVSGKK